MVWHSQLYPLGDIMDKKFDALGLTSLAKKIRGEPIDDKPLPLVIGAYVQMKNKPCIPRCGEKGYIDRHEFGDYLVKFIKRRSTESLWFPQDYIIPLVTIGSRIKIDIGGFAKHRIKEGIVSRITSKHIPTLFYVKPYGWFGIDKIKV